MSFVKNAHSMPDMRPACVCTCVAERVFAWNQGNNCTPECFHGDLTTRRYLQGANFWGLSPADSGGLGAGTAAAAAAAAAASAATAAAAAFTRATGFEAPGFYGSSPSSGTLATAGSIGGSSSSSGSSNNPPEPGGSRSARGSDFKAGWDLLQRSLACFLKDKAAKNGMQLPAAWNPLAWLVVFCAVVKRDTRQDGKLVALSSRINAAAVAGEAGASGGVAAAISDSSLGSMVVGPAGGPGGQAFAGGAADTPGEWPQLQCSHSCKPYGLCFLHASSSSCSSGALLVLPFCREGLVFPFLLLQQTTVVDKGVSRNGHMCLLAFSYLLTRLLWAFTTHGTSGHRPLSADRAVFAGLTHARCTPSKSCLNSAHRLGPRPYGVLSNPTLSPTSPSPTTPPIHHQCRVRV
jgi:hypothetical protein